MWYISVQLVRVAVNVTMKSNWTSSAIGHAPTDSHRLVRDQVHFWTALLVTTVAEVPKRMHVLIMMNANIPNGVRGDG